MTEINLEIEETITMRTRQALLFHCKVCLKQVRMVGINEAAMIAKLNAREIFRLVESDQLHFTEDQSGLIFVCLPSLREFVREVDATL